VEIPKLVVFDVDGTLLDSQGVCQQRTLNALDALRAAEIPIAVATGRPLALAPFTLQLMDGADFVSCGNGASLLELATGTLLRDACLPRELVEPIVQGLRHAVPGIGFALEMTHAVVEEPGFADKVPPSPHEPPVDDVLDVVRSTEHGVRKIIPFHDDYAKRQPELASITAQFIDDRCEVQHGMLPIVEVATAGESKAVALEVLVDHLGIQAASAVAFGDGGNDIEMLQWAGTGVAMGNARAEVQAAADQVTAHVDEGGVAVFIEALFERDIGA